MKKVELHHDVSGLRAVVLPDYGAMVAELSLNGVDLLHMNYEMLGIGNVLAGGIPLLFPFAGKSLDDAMIFHNRKYAMPMHGFAKDLPFALIEAEAQRCRLALEDNDMTRTYYYPFRYCLAIEYELDGDALAITASIKNNDENAIPFALGFHPYFRTTDKQSALLSLPARDYYDYTACGLNGTPVAARLESDPSLADLYDHVFYQNQGARIRLDNPHDRYRAEIVGDKTFAIVTLSTSHPNASCIEPWQAFPNALGRTEFLQSVHPGETRSFFCRISFSEL